ncbi:hypothetical protein KGP26_18385 [Serratia sp. JSRIV002]|uniref:hypothetical protein n=1 Tax=Serratia sp. JSRIV002 TaxID=2831894 RepID=UPI001CBD8F85|nr:hypothetical protein [Serratia sp. JSRIV002]UAN49729.1 hypothetical protein KGP26_18385 [Serratia sp. JSRIV002]
MTTLPEKLTNAELRQIIDSHEKGHCMVIRTNADYRMAKELLAVREAQSVPVAWTDREELAFNHDMACMWTKGMGINEVALYTAQTAPAVPTELLDAMAEVIRISDRDHEAWDRAKAAISDCRAAMIQLSGNSEHVSQGYTLNSPVIPDGWKLVPIVELTEKMVIHGFESEGFEALADAVQDKKGWPYSCRESAECVTGIFKAMVEVAPSPGGADDSHATAS